MSKKQFIIRVNCIGFQDYKVLAYSQREAKDEAYRLFQCDSTEGEFGEFLEEESYLGDGEIWVAHSRNYTYDGRKIVEQDGTV